MTRWLVVSLAIALAFAPGCAHHYGTDRQLRMSGKLPAGVSVYLPEPVPTTGYPSAGAQTAEALRNAFERNGARVEIGPAADAIAALAAARARSAEYLVLASVEHWEDRNTEWSGKPDRIEIEVHVVDAKTGAAVDGARITGTSRSGTFGGDHPQDLLAKPTHDYVTSLFQGEGSAQ